MTNEKTPPRRVAVNGRGYVIGQDHHRAKLADADIEIILTLREAGLSFAAIAAKFDDLPGGLSKSYVRYVCHGSYRGQPHAGTKLAPLPTAVRIVQLTAVQGGTVAACTPPGPSDSSKP